jgi:hypothetical protein
VFITSCHVSASSKSAIVGIQIATTRTETVKKVPLLTNLALASATRSNAFGGRSRRARISELVVLND